jgi:hypothetical protein
MSQGKIGRPGKKDQTRPLIFERVRSRVTRQVSMSAKTGEDLDRYIMWAAAAVGADEEEAMLLTMDKALTQFFQRDKLFQESVDGKKKDGSGSSAGPTAASPASPSRAGV